jgi:hypothetical protein
MGEKAGSVRGVGVSVFGEIIDEPFIGDDYCELEKAVLYIPLRILVDRGKEYKF